MFKNVILYNLQVLLMFLLMWIRSAESVVTTNLDPTGNSHIAKTLMATSPKTAATPRVLKIDDYEPNESISSPFMQPYPSASMNFQPRWFNDGNKLEANWFGFNRFIPRSARNMHMAQNHRMRDAQLLGESTFMYPTAHIYHPSPTFFFEDVTPFQHHVNDLQSQSTVPYHDHFVNPRLEQHSMRFQRGYSASNERPQQQQHRPFYNQNQQHFNYQRSNSNLQRSSASPTPVMIKILPLKLSSIDISNALKSMSWIPIPIDLLKGNNNNNNNNNHHQNEDNNRPVYSDKRQSMFDEDEDESDLPPPSSHVATPPVGITYAEGQRSERYVSRFTPPK